MPKKVILIILDGFGEGKPDSGNAIYLANTPFIDSMKKKYKWSLIEPGGQTVGVLKGQTGGSDVGHITIGSGRVIRQPIKIIYDAIENKSFFKNKKLIAAIDHAKNNNSNLHLIGIGADSFIHSYTNYIYALLDLFNKENFSLKKVFLHLAADGRDNNPTSGIDFFKTIELEMKKRNCGHIASIFGRFYLDRGKNWDRTKILYEMLTKDNLHYIKDWKKYFEENYKNNITDEFLYPIALGNEKGIYPRIKDNDAIINFCYRADRERQITEAICEESFNGFKKTMLNNLHYVGFIQYSPTFKNAHYAFDEESPNICFSEILEQNGLKQLHLAGKEKIIFVTYNMNRCKNLNIKNETDIKAPQTKEVETFDKNPEMSAPNITKIMLDEIEKNENDVYIINYENCDQVGHTGNLEATIKAVEAVDISLSKIIPKALKKGFEILITADHGNADVMIDEYGNPQTSHSLNKVPCIFVSKRKNLKLRDGELSDIAPTILSMLNIKTPKEMTGKSLII